MKGLTQYITEAKLKGKKRDCLMDTDTRRFLKANKSSSYEAFLKKCAGDKEWTVRDLNRISDYELSLMAKTIGILIKKYPQYDFSGKFFHSGYAGYSVANPELRGGKLLFLIEQGRIGLENHSPAEIYWGAGADCSESFRHKDKRFGDVEFNSDEFDEAVKFMVDEFDKFALK